LGGILTAMTKFPEAAWLVLACDLPFVNEGAIAKLMETRNPFKLATAYRSAQEHGMPEPLCAIYEPKAVFRLLQFLGQGMACPRKILMNSDVCLIVLDEEFVLDNINRPEEYRQAINLIKDRCLGDN